MEDTKTYIDDLDGAKDFISYLCVILDGLTLFTHEHEDVKLTNTLCHIANECFEKAKQIEEAMKASDS